MDIKSKSGGARKGWKSFNERRNGPKSDKGDKGNGDTKNEGVVFVPCTPRGGG